MMTMICTKVLIDGEKTDGEQWTETKDLRGHCADFTPREWNKNDVIAENVVQNTKDIDHQKDADVWNSFDR